MRAPTIVCALVLACGPAEPGDVSATATSTGNDPTSSTVATTTTPTDSLPSDTTAAETQGTGTEAGSTVTGQFPSECDLFTQNCPPGMKCTFFSENVYKEAPVSTCVPLAPEPQPPDQPCHFNEPGMGLDDCELGSFCLPWLSDQAGNSSCVSLCEAETFACADDAHACIIMDTPLFWCHFTCDVLKQDCAEGLACSLQRCLSVSTGFFDRQPGEPCEAFEQCIPRSVCGAAEYVPNCPDERCCTELCDLQTPGVCALAGQSCQPIPERDTLGSALPEGVGLCMST